ncbi:MAG: flagellar protein FliS [Stellaceae bacterium]
MENGRQSLSGPAAYRAIQGIGAAPEELMKMAVDSARGFLLRAEAAIAAGDQASKAKALNSAAKIVEFVLGLSGTEPGPLSDSLARVYHYVLAAILKGNVWDDAEAVAAGRIAMEQLAMVWRRAFPDASGSEVA